jgi:hypothetical protein
MPPCPEIHEHVVFIKLIFFAFFYSHLITAGNRLHGGDLCCFLRNIYTPASIYIPNKHIPAFFRRYFSHPGVINVENIHGKDIIIKFQRDGKIFQPPPVLI